MFEMNGIEWKVVEVEQKELWNEGREVFKDDGEHFFGKCMPFENKILISRELSYVQKRRTLIHELTHCYIFSYITFNEKEYTEDDFCDINANSFDIIQKIVDRIYPIKSEIVTVNTFIDGKKIIETIKEETDVK